MTYNILLGTLVVISRYCVAVLWQQIPKSQLVKLEFICKLIKITYLTPIMSYRILIWPIYDT